ncbi:MAG TPA: lyase family protein [Usitatibacter sp.]|jgi:3-carboxy-cis,cis-muconate cycloisomerase|nr:lyase family protein [Usitatibacter sp.]
MAASLAARTLARPSFENAFGARAFVRAMLDFEAALAQAQAAEGLVPEAHARAIVEGCATVAIDEEALVHEARRNASLAVPLVRMLREHVARASKAAAGDVHRGATSQDVLDTATALCLRPCLEEADRALDAAVRSLARRAREHRATPMLARTLLQPAMAMPAGLKIARWAAALAADRERLAESQAAALALQLGGPVGSLEGMGGKGPAVRHRMALALGLADVPEWQSHRSGWIDLLDRVGLAVLTCGKIARDVALLAQAEVGEMLEAPPREGVGGSSAMPHKRNPVACARALAAAVAMPGLLATVHAAALGEHERALGGWQAELAVVPEIAAALGAALDFADTIAVSLVVDPARMRENLARLAEAPAVDPRAVDEVLAGLARHLA